MNAILSLPCCTPSKTPLWIAQRVLKPLLMLLIQYTGTESLAQLIPSVGPKSCVRTITELIRPLISVRSSSLHFLSHQHVKAPTAISNTPAVLRVAEEPSGMSSSYFKVPSRSCVHRCSSNVCENVKSTSLLLRSPRSSSRQDRPRRDPLDQISLCH